MDKILLINPGFSDVYGKYKPLAKIGANWLPLGLAYLASNIKNCEVRVLDMEINPDIKTALSSFNPDYVGITFTTPLYKKAMELFKYVKEFNDKIHTIAGGVHSTILPEEVLKSGYVDTVIPGEGEIAINKFLANPVKGIFPKQPLIQNLDEIKFPARKLFENDKYLFSVPGKGITKVTSFMSSRGCPGRCTFCSQHLMFGHCVRYRSVKNCIEEMREIKGMGISHLSMIDDTLGLNKKLTYDLCNNMIKEKFDFTFEGYTRVDCVNMEYLNNLKKAGLVRLAFGVESGNQNILDAIKKGTNLEQIRKAYELADKAGIEETVGSVVLGLPFETEETIKKTIKFIKTLKCKQIYISVLVPFPGTEVYEQAIKGYGGLKLLTKDWGEYTKYGKVVIDVNDLKKEDLMKWHRKSMLAFYLRPKQLWYNMTRAGFKDFVKNGYAFVKSMV